MMKFASFETIVEMLYKYAIPTPKDQCSKELQLGVSFAGGYVAGVFCAIVSHPADNLVSFLNNAKGATVGDVSASYITNHLLNLYFSVLCIYLYIQEMIFFSGCEEDGDVGPFHPWSSSSYCHDWNSHRSPMGNI